MKTFEEFVKDIQSSAELKAKLEAAVADVQTAEEKTAVIVKLAQENGYEVSVEDLSGMDAGKRKLDDEELQLASGGLSLDTCIRDETCGLIFFDCETSQRRLRAKRMEKIKVH